MADLKTVHIELPARTEDLRALEIGSVAYLTGRVFTAREGVYKRAIADGVGMPASKDALGITNFHCSPAASINADGSHTVGAVTATASFRFAQWLGGWFKISGCNVIIGKGGMTSATYREHFVPNNAVYLTTVGYGTGALLGRGIKRVAGVYWLEELGLAQAVWVLDVEKFGPFLVESDLAGNSLVRARERQDRPRPRPALCRHQAGDAAALRRDRRQDRGSHLTFEPGADMKRTVFAILPAILAVSALPAQRAGADEVRHTTFPSVLVGTWAPSAELCAAKDKSSITIAADGYSTADGKCSVGWIVETAGSRGPNYAVHAKCEGDTQNARADVVNMILRPEGGDRVSIGKSFTDLKPYLRCP